MVKIGHAPTSSRLLVSLATLLMVLVGTASLYSSDGALVLVRKGAVAPAHSSKALVSLPAVPLCQGRESEVPVLSPLPVLGTHSALARETGELDVVLESEGLDQSRRPLSNRKLHLRPHDGRRLDSELASRSTDARGRGAWSGLPTGDYWLRIEGLAMRVITIAPGEVRQVSVVLQDLVTITGTVVDAAGLPVPGAAIFVSDYSSTREVSEVARADTSGVFSFEAVLSARRDLCARAPGFEVAAAQPLLPTNLNAKRSYEVQFILKRGGALLAGRVVDMESRGIPGAEVLLRLFGGSGGARPGALPGRRAQRYLSMRAETGPDGSFSFHGVPRAAFSLSSMHEGFASNSIGSEGGQVDWQNILLTLERESVLSGRIVDENGIALEGTHVGVGRWSDPCARWVQSDSEGRYTLDSLSPGTAKVHCRLEGYEPLVSEVPLALGQQVSHGDWILHLKEGRRITGRVDPPVPYPGGYWVVCIESEGERLLTSTVNGKFEVGPWRSSRGQLSVSYDLGTKLVVHRESVSLADSKPLLIQVPTDRAQSTHVTGRVVTQVDRVNEAHLLSFYPLGSTVRLETATTPVDGRFAIQLPNRGEWAYDVTTLDGDLVDAGRLGWLGGGELNLGEIELRGKGWLEVQAPKSGGGARVDRVKVVTLSGSTVLDFPVGTERTLCLPAGQYDVIETAGGVVLGTRTVSVRAGETWQLVPGSCASFTSGLRILFKGADLDSGWIRICRDQTEVYSGCIAMRSSSEDGSWSMKCAPGQYVITISVHLDRIVQRSVLVGDGLETDLDLRELTLP